MDNETAMAAVLVLFCEIGNVDPHTILGLKRLETREAVALVTNENGTKRIHWFAEGENGDVAHPGTTDLDPEEFAADPDKAIEDAAERFFTQ